CQQLFQKVQHLSVTGDNIQTSLVIQVIKSARAENLKMTYFLCCVAVACLVSASAATAETPADPEKFISNGVVPDVLDQAPSALACVKYGSLNVDQGNILTPSQVKHQPKVNYAASSEKFYTLIMVDPDAPSRITPLFREWLHWRVVNIPGNNVTQGQTSAEYRGAGPPKGTGLHRYVFAVFEQPSGQMSIDEPYLTADQKSASDRGKFSVKKFVSKYSLGNPVAGNFFQAEWEAAPK
ncbi:unnamed protein product, partial [Allacma fusca]